MYKFDKFTSSFVSDVYKNLHELLIDSSTIFTIESLQCVQAIQILIPEISLNHKLNLTKCSNLSFFLNETYNKENYNLKYLLVESIPIHFILHPIFLKNYIQKGKLNIQTTNFDIEIDDYLTLDSNGILSLIVNQKSYTKIGLVGKLIYGYKKNFALRKYLIEIDLTELNNFDSNLYKQKFNSLKKSELKLDLMIKWIPDHNNCSPLSLIRFFNLIKNQELNNDEFFDENKFQNIIINQCAPIIRCFNLENFSILNLEEIDINKVLTKETIKHSKLKNLIDSFGLAFCGPYSNNLIEDSEVNSFNFNENNSKNLKCLELTGFFDSNNVRKILSELFDLLKDNSLDYIVLIVNGFENSIKSWSGTGNIHLKNLSGENLYGLFLSTKYKNFIWRIGDKNDFGIEKL